MSDLFEKILKEILNETDNVQIRCNALAETINEFQKDNSFILAIRKKKKDE